MKKVSTVLLTSFIFLCMHSSANAQDSKCLLNANGIVSTFIRVGSDSSDDELHSIEKKEDGMFKFLLKEGHGIIRLEVYRKNIFYAGTLIQKGTSSPDTRLNLQVIDDQGRELEAYCGHLLEE